MIRYELQLAWKVNPGLIQEFFDEFERFGEYCNVLWHLYDVGVAQWVQDAASDQKTFYLCFFVNDRLVGMARVTPQPNHIENGRVGYAIRPTCRGNLYAPTMLRLIEDYCKWIALREVTACIDSSNIKSIKAFDRAGWQATGNVYKWTGNRLAIEVAPIKP